MRTGDTRAGKWQGTGDDDDDISLSPHAGFARENAEEDGNENGGG